MNTIFSKWHSLTIQQNKLLVIFFYSRNSGNDSAKWMHWHKCSNSKKISFRVLPSLTGTVSRTRVYTPKEATPKLAQSFVVYSRLFSHVQTTWIFFLQPVKFVCAPNSVWCSHWVPKIYSSLPPKCLGPDLSWIYISGVYTSSTQGTVCNMGRKVWSNKWVASV